MLLDNMMQARYMFHAAAFWRVRELGEPAAMRLTRHTDYALRVLLYLAARGDALTSIAEIAAAYGISHNHLMKVVNGLVRQGALESVRGRFGGVRLGQPPGAINIGAVVRQTEEGFDLVDCAQCRIASACGVNGVLGEALTAFLAVLDRYSLADVMARPADFMALFPAPDAALLPAH